jgi:hypothetical protein
MSKRKVVTMRTVRDVIKLFCCNLNSKPECLSILHICKLG